MIYSHLSVKAGPKDYKYSLITIITKPSFGRSKKSICDYPCFWLVNSLDYRRGFGSWIDRWQVSDKVIHNGCSPNKQHYRYTTSKCQFANFMKDNLWGCNPRHPESWIPSKFNLNFQYSLNFSLNLKYCKNSISR